MKKSIILLLLLTLFSTYSYSQGCVMIRSINGFGQYNGLNNSFTTSEWQITASSRYYSSNKNYFEGEDFTPTKENQTVNSVFTAEVTVARLLKNGWSLDLTIPYTDGSRTSNQEHGGINTTPRYTTRATGLGDIRFMGRKWLLAPSTYQRGNIQLGLGLKFATGDYKYQDYFHKNDTTVVLSYVNPSIQLGDGGTGIMTELNAYYFLNSKRTLSVYGNVFYMFSPRDQNGVLFTAGSTPAPPSNPALRALHYENSVPDIWALRAGMEYNLKNWGFSFGLRDEGVPVHDVLGASNGLRRPGYNLAIEPGIIYNQSRFSIFFYLPVFIKHDIKLSVTDEKKGEITNAPVVSPGGSGDYLIFLGAQFRL
jgi:hypothetical protein